MLLTLITVCFRVCSLFVFCFTLSRASPYPSRVCAAIALVPCMCGSLNSAWALHRVIAQGVRGHFRITLSLVGCTHQQFRYHACVVRTVARCHVLVVPPGYAVARPLCSWEHQSETRTRTRKAPDTRPTSRREYRIKEAQYQI